jgi:hypothetical protein
MKNKFSISVVAVLLFFSLISHAQSVLVVEPGIGTLNAAVKTYGGTRIYQLKAGEWYGLDAPIENVDYHLQVIGAEPTVAGGMPATLQTGSNTGGAPFAKMFDAKGNITLRNIYFVNADLTAQVGDQFIVQSKANTRIIVDRCVLHPAAVSIGINGLDRNIKTYFTNNQVIDHGHQLSPNDNAFFIFADVANAVGVDTLLVENNTFVCMGTNMFNGQFGSLVHNVVNFNHNTFVLTKSQLVWATKKQEEFWTNNLMFDVNTQPYATSWQPMPGGDVSMPKPNLIFAAPLDNEVLPSIRPNFVQYNSHYRAQGFYDLITELNTFANTKSLPNVYLFPLVWPKDSINCREAQMFNSTNYPKFKYGNTITNVDPQWVDTKIYEHEANFIKWTKPASYIHALAQPSGDYPAPTAWPQYWWIPSGDLSYNSVWPVFNGKYTNPQTLTGSIENLPLGDLNWFPASKAIWLSKKAIIDAHIKAGNTDKINLTAIAEVKDQSIMIYPNPAKNEILIQGVQNAEVNILSLDGRTLKAVKNVTKVNVSDIANGSYLISIKEGNRISTQKLLIQK